MTTDNQPDDGTSGSAFPRQRFENHRIVVQEEDGLTPRQYAAIHLNVPDSGTPWLDKMIRESLRNEWAGQALANSLITRGATNGMTGTAETIFQFADAMLAERDRRAEGGEEP